MKRAFVRGIWGVIKPDKKQIDRRKMVSNDIKNIVKKNKFSEPFITYVYGQENYDQLTGIGLECILIDKEPYYDNWYKRFYRHKLEIFKIAMEDYDEIVFLDWDCLPTKKLPDNFWKVLGKKESIQANLTQYKRAKCFWRKKEPRKIPNSGFVYMRDKTIPQKIIDIWEDFPAGYKDLSSSEPPIAKLTDDMTDGWKGKELYWDLFEPEFCNLNGGSPFPRERLEEKNSCFIHNCSGKRRGKARYKAFEKRQKENKKKSKGKS